MLGGAVLLPQWNMTGYKHLTSLRLTLSVICLDYISCVLTDFTGFNKDTRRKIQTGGACGYTSPLRSLHTLQNIQQLSNWYAFLFDTYWRFSLDINAAAQLLIEINRTYGFMWVFACLKHNVISLEMPLHCQANATKLTIDTHTTKSAKLSLAGYS